MRTSKYVFKSQQNGSLTNKSQKIHSYFLFATNSKCERFTYMCKEVFKGFPKYRIFYDGFCRVT